MKITVTEDTNINIDVSTDNDIGCGVSEAINITSATSETAEVTPSEITQTITPQSADYLSEVTVNPIPSEYIIPSGEIEISSSGEYDVTQYASAEVSFSLQDKIATPGETTQTIVADEGYDGLSSVEIEAITSETQTVTPTKSVQTITPTADYLSSVTVNPIPSEYIVPSGTKNIGASGTHDVTKYASANVSIPLETKTVTPSESTQTVTPDECEGLSSVEVGAISNTYIGSAIVRDPSITVSGKMVSIPSGYYSANSSKSVQDGSVGTPTVSFNNGRFSTEVTVGEGYVQSDTKSNSYTLSTIGETSYTPTTSNIVIPADKYLTGVQTIQGDANLIASNIKSGVSIFGVAGGLTYSWIGENVEFVQNVYNHTYALKDTDYNSWTPSTTAKVIVATQTLSGITLSSNYDYLVVWSTYIAPVYNSGTTKKAAIEKQVVIGCQGVYCRPQTVTYVESNTFNNMAYLNFSLVPVMFYYNSSSNRTLAYSGSYGFYPALQNPSISSPTSSTPTLTLKTPTLNARCYSTYFSTSMANAVDKSNSNLILKGDLYRVKPKSSTQAGLMQMAIDLINA